jgi:hypothetical protein
MGREDAALVEREEHNLVTVRACDGLTLSNDTLAYDY